MWLSRNISCFLRLMPTLFGWNSFPNVCWGLLCLVISANKLSYRQRAFRGNYYAFGLESFVRLRGAYNSLLHVPPGPAERGLGGSHPTGFRRALNQNLDWEAIENEYLSKELPLLWFDGWDIIGFYYVQWIEVECACRISIEYMATCSWISVV